MTVQRGQKYWKNKADDLFKQLVRRGGVCERCGKRGYPTSTGPNGGLETSHVLSRRYANTRCDFRNAFCLCSSCHRWVTANPLGHAEFFHKWHAERFEQQGSPTPDEDAMALGETLRRLAYSGDKVDWQAVYERLLFEEKRAENE